MKAGNISYNTGSDIPPVVPVFPLPGALLLPSGQLPLNIFEPRYLTMIDDALAGDRLIAMAQPADFDGNQVRTDLPDLCKIGCLGRLVSMQETGDGRYVISLFGICRVHIDKEATTTNGYRNFNIRPIEGELENPDSGEQIDRQALEDTFRKYLDANRMEADWDSVQKTDNESLVTALCMMSPYGPAEKQALLEAPSLKARAETLIALTEIHLARNTDDTDTTLQ